MFEYNAKEFNAIGTQSRTRKITVDDRQTGRQADNPITQKIVPTTHVRPLLMWDERDSILQVVWETSATCSSLIYNQF